MIRRDESGLRSIGRRSRFVTIFWHGLIETAIRFGRGGHTFGAGGESGIFPIYCSCITQT